MQRGVLFTLLLPPMRIPSSWPLRVGSMPAPASLVLPVSGGLELPRATGEFCFARVPG